MRAPGWLRNGVATVVPAAGALTCAPLRASVPGAAAAVVLVGMVALLGPLAARWAAVAGAALVAVTFDVVWTKPYGSLQIHATADIATSLTLLVVGLALSERGRRSSPVGPDRRRYRPRPRLRRPPAPPDATSQLMTIGRVAEDIAEGDDAGLVVLDVARGMVDLLKLRDCRFELAPLEPSDRATLQRNGEVVARGRSWSPSRIGVSGFDVPVVAHGEVLGRFVCVTRTRQRISQDRLRAALTLADQAALALWLSPDTP